MNKPLNPRPLVIALGATFALGGAAAQASVFQATDLASGYMVAAAGETKPGEMKCGEGKCGDAAAKKKLADEAAAKPEAKAAEHKCGEGKCGEKKPEAPQQ